MIRALRSKHLVHGTSHWLSGWYKKPWNQWASPTLTTVDQMANRIFVLDTPCSSLIKDWVDAWHMEPKLFFPSALASGTSFLQTRSSEIWWCCLANWFGDWTFDCNVRNNPSSGSRWNWPGDDLGCTSSLENWPESICQSSEAILQYLHWSRCKQCIMYRLARNKSWGWEIVRRRRLDIRSTILHLSWSISSHQTTKSMHVYEVVIMCM